MKPTIQSILDEEEVEKIFVYITHIHHYLLDDRNSHPHSDSLGLSMRKMCVSTTHSQANQFFHVIYTISAPLKSVNICTVRRFSFIISDCCLPLTNPDNFELQHDQTSAFSKKALSIQRNINIISTWNAPLNGSKLLGWIFSIWMQDYSPFQFWTIE